MKRLASFLAFTVLLTLAAQNASGAVYFSENFEGTPPLAQWNPIGNAIVVTDPQNGGNKVLSFSGTGSGGVIFTIDQVTTTTTYTLEFDYLGTVIPPGVDYGGGFIGVNNLGGGPAPTETWLYGDSTYPTMFGNLINDGTWNHYSATFTVTSVGGPLQLKLEDFGGFGASPTYNNAFFDNIVLRDTSVTPEPATMLMWGIGMAGLGAAGLRRRWKCKAPA